jgi:hypothetical protein
VSGPTPRQDNDCAAAPESRPGAWTSWLGPARLRSAATRRRHRRRDRAGQDSNGGWLAYAVREAARLTGLCRDLLYGQMRLSNPVCVKADTWRLIICQLLPLFPGIAS